VFISHSSADAAVAARVHGWLFDAGHDVFLDHDLRDGIQVGDDWERRLHERLRWADAVVCVVTAAYRASTWCSAEVGIARSRGSVLLPLRVEPAADHPLLPMRQCADLTGDADGARDRLVKAVARRRPGGRARLARRPVTVSRPAPVQSRPAPGLLRPRRRHRPARRPAPLAGTPRR
jgi:hypothetical protein